MGELRDHSAVTQVAPSHALGPALAPCSNGIPAPASPITLRTVGAAGSITVSEGKGFVTVRFACIDATERSTADKGVTALSALQELVARRVGWGRIVAIQADRGFPYDSRSQKC